MAENVQNWERFEPWQNMAYLLSSLCTETFAKLCIGLPHLISAAFVRCAVEWVSCWTSLFIIFTATAKVYSAQMSGQKFELCPSASRYYTLQYEPKRGVILCEIFCAKHFSLVFVADSTFCNSCYCFSLAFVVYSRTVLQQTIFHCARRIHKFFVNTEVALVVLWNEKRFVSTNWTCPRGNLTCWCLQSMNAARFLFPSFLCSFLCQPSSWLTL